MVHIQIEYTIDGHTYIVQPIFPQSFINPEDGEVWAKYLKKKIEGLIKEDVCQSQEFQELRKEIMQRRAEEKAQRQRYEEREERRKETEKRRKCMERPKIDYVPKGLHIDLEEAYEKYMQQVVTFQPENKEDFLYMLRLLERWINKSVPQVIEKNRPDAAHAIAMSLCRSLPLLIIRSDISEYLDEYKLRIGKLAYATFEALSESVKAWNNEAERKRTVFVIKQQLGYYKTYKNVQKRVVAIMPMEAFAGEPVPVEREMNDAEQREAREKERKRKEKELQMLEAEREAKSLIPLNIDYEIRIFDRRNINEDCSRIWYMMTDEEKNIRELTDKGAYKEAALLFLQLTKSMCRHFILDRHWEYFDDLYSPEYAIEDMVKWFGKLKREKKLPKDVDRYLHEAWKEIAATECCTDYGLPRKELPF